MRPLPPHIPLESLVLASSAAIRLLEPAAYRTMPWRNGGGRTTEIAASPRDADLASFAWRVSIADIERDGPFSAFPGVDRTLVLLAGHGMRLVGANGALELRAPLDAVTFAGEDPLDCALAAGPTRDFNLMVRRQSARGTLDVVRDAARTFADVRTLLCFAAAGAAECAIAGQTPIVVPPEHTLILERATAAGDVMVRAPTTGGAALVCTLAEVAGRQAA